MQFRKMVKTFLYIIHAGHVPALAALSADAGQPRHLRLSRQQQRHSAKLGRPALHPQKTPLARQRPEQRASHHRGERFFPC